MEVLPDAKALKVIEVCTKFDVDNTGTINLRKLCNVMRQLEPPMSAETMLGLIDASGLCSLNYSEFFSWLYGPDSKLSNFSLPMVQPGDQSSHRTSKDEASTCTTAEARREASASAAQNGPPLMDAATQYAKIEEELGGRQGIEAFKERSEYIRKTIKQRLDEMEAQAPWRHDVVFHCLGLEKLIEQGRQAIKPVLDAVVTSLARKYESKEHLPPTKGVERSQTKIRVRYGGDASQLSDVCRATLEVSMDKCTMEGMYALLEEMLEMDILRCSRVHLSFFHDRYQRPMNGYMDFLFLLRINGYVCELQVNFDKLLSVKESGPGHGKYEVDRKRNDDVIYFAMSGNPTDLVSVLEEGADPNACRDMYGLTTLHYAVQQGSARMVQALISKRADALALDSRGRLPIHRAVLSADPEVIELLLDAMEHAPLDCCKRGQEALGEMSAASLEIVPGVPNLPESLIHRVIKWASQRVAKGSLWHFWAATGRSAAFLRAWKMGLGHVIGSLSDVDDWCNTPLDYAMNSNSQAIIECLLHADQPALCMMPHFAEDCIPSIRALLDGFPSDVSNLTSVTLLRGENQAGREKAARFASQRGDLRAVHAYYLAGVNLSQPGPATRLNTAHRAAQSGQLEVVDFLVKVGTSLLHGLKDPDRKTRAKVAECLGSLDNEVLKAHVQDFADLVALLQDDEPEVRQAAAVALVKIGVAKTEVQLYAETLSTVVETARECQQKTRAARYLGQLGEEVAGQYAALIASLIRRYHQNYSWEADVRQSAVEALGKLGEAGNSQVAEIVRCFTDKDADTQRSAVSALVQLRNVSAAMEVLDNGNGTAKCNSLRALARMGELVGEHAATIAKYLQDGNKNVRKDAVMVLGRLGLAAHAYTEAIVERVGEGHTRITAIEALVRLGLADDEVKKQAAKEAAKLEKKPHPDKNAAQHMWKMGPAAISPHAPALVKSLIPNPKVQWHEVTRQHAMKALGVLGEDAAPYAPEIAERLQDNHKFVRAEAAKAMLKLGSGAAPQAGALALCLKDNDKNLQRLAAQVLKSLGPPAQYASELECWEEAQDD